MLRIIYKFLDQTTIIIFIMDQTACGAKMGKILQNILKRYNAQLLTKLVIHSHTEEQSSIAIRHYDQECQSANNIVDIIKTVIQRRKMQAMITMKIFARPRFSRTNTPRRSNSVGNKEPYFRRKDESQQQPIRAQRSTSVQKKQCQSDQPSKNQLKQIFDQVRNLAINSLTPTPKKLYGYSKTSQIPTNDEYNLRKNNFLHKLSELEADFSQLIETEKKLVRAEQKDKQGTNKKRQSYRERGRKIRMIDINFC